MNIRQVYERTAFEKELSEQRFCELASEAIELIISQYGEKYTIGEKGSFDGIKTFNDSTDVFEEYMPSIADYVLYRLGAADRYELYALKANNAYLNVWRRLSKGKAVKAKLGGEYFV